MSQEELLNRYASAAALLPSRLYPLIRNRWVKPHWTGRGDSFWYRRDRDDHGHEFVLIDPAAPDNRESLFDHEELAGRLSAVLGVELDPYELPIAGYEHDQSGAPAITLSDGRLVAPGPTGALVVSKPRAGTLTSPDGAFELFCREYDLWARDRSMGAERRLTAGGMPYYAWGAPPDNTYVHLPMKRSGRVIPPALAAFSPSGRMVVTGRVDERAVGDWPFVEHLPADRARPRLHGIRVTLDDEPRSGDAQLAFINPATGHTKQITDSDDLLARAISTGFDTLAWGVDEECVYVFSHTPGHRRAQLVRIDTTTGERRVVISETEDPIYEPNTFVYGLPLIQVLPRSNEVIWFSQRDGWGHLYRYDLTSGTCRNAISTGRLVVRDLIRVDEDRREVLFLAGRGDEGDNPYWRKLYRGSLDGGDQTLLTPEPVDHEIPAPFSRFYATVLGTTFTSAVSPSGRYVVDHMSTISRPPEIVLRETRTGAITATLERTDVDALLAAGYRPPEQFQVKADDGHTDLWGIITLPLGPTAEERAPVIDLIYAGYQRIAQPTSYLSVDGPGSTDNVWSAAAASAFAALGFATVIMDGRGTPGRDKTFRQWTHDHSDVRRGLADHVTAIRTLAKSHPLDLDRVGITGHSYGGYNSLRAMLLFPDFFKVCVSSAGVHVPQKMPKGSWNWHLGADTPHDSPRYQALGNPHLVDRLAGRLLLLFGDLDENVTPDHTLALIDALIRAGKRFDMKLWPGVDHYGIGSPVVISTIWDYFVEHLLGAAPPTGGDR
jgi:dipeptidyl-peptidase 4